ncbi:MAG: RHS repeat-associated core domain-containing protein [Pyrinomonadaceae bacterium]
MNRPHENNARFVHAFIRTVTSTPIAIATYLRILRGMALILFSLVVPITLQADVCESVGGGASQNISAHITINGTTTEVTNQPVLPLGTQIRIDSVATAYGNCAEMFWNCDGGCSCVPSGTTFNRTINHISVTYDASTAGSLNGNYSLGSVFGLNPNGTTAFWNVLDTQASNSTGPKYFTLSVAGAFQFHLKAIINTTICEIPPDETEQIDITIYVGDKDGSVDFGVPPCNSNVASPAAVGEPINVTNGNMYIQQTDYRLPGFGEGLEVTRTYNSRMQRSGIFGYGWSSVFDESIIAYGTTFLSLNLPDARAVYFSRPSTSDPYLPKKPLDLHGQIVKNVDNTYTLTFQNGRIHQFNTSGKLVSMADRNNNTITLTYDANSNPITATDAAGRTLTLTYDSSGKVTSIADSSGTIATYTRASLGKLSAVTYADGSKFTFTFLTSGSNIYVGTVKDALNNVIESHTYDSQGRALTSEIAGNGTERYTLNYISATETDVTDALGHVTKYFYDTSKGRNVVTSVEGSCSCGNAQIQSWSYDSQLNITSRTDALTHTTSYTYDTNGNRLTETDATGTVTYTYSSLGEVLTRTDQMNGVTTNTYNAQGDLLTTTDALNNTTTFTYDSHGQLLTVTDPRNNATTFTYDTNGNLTRRTDALNNQTNTAYDARGRVTSVTNALNQTTSYEYDLAGRLKKTIYPDTSFVLLTCDLAGRRTKIKDPRGYETTFAYDAAYRLTSETNPDAKVTSYAYDLMSNLTGVTDALSRTTNYTYDDFNRLTKIKYPEATAGAGRLEENFAYDSAGSILQTTDQAGKVTSFCYDSSNRLTSTTDPALKTTAYEYNARSQETAVVDAISQRYEFVYDALGHRTQEKKGTATMTFSYDAAGNRNQRTDYNNAVTNYSHDALNRMTTISYPDTSATYGYDVISRLTTATNPSGTVTIAYDNRSRVSSVTDVFGQAVSYAYDANSNRTQLSLNGGTSATYQYDVINRLTQLADNASLNTTFAYDATNKLTSRTLPNGVVATSQYDGLNRLTRLTHAKGANTLADFQYQFNPVNDITQMTEGAGSHNYTYDSIDRLTAATHPNQTNESYTFDDVGNRTASHQGSSYTYQAFNRLVAANGESFGCDANGNLTSKTDAGGSWTYTWDYENRLKQSSKAGGVTVIYAYDALGRRIQRLSTASGTTKFVYDGADVLRDLDGGGSTVADYLNGPGIDNKLRQTIGTASYFIADHLGTTRAFTDASGNLASSLTYDSFGNVASGSAATRFTYTGREFDSETGLMFYRARWYDPQQGRFISEDPIGFESGGINLFAYVDNNPINLMDPMGLRPSLRRCLIRCAADQFGISTILGATGVVSGLPLIKKPFITPLSSRGTSVASKVLSGLFPQKLPFRVLAPTVARPFARSVVLGRVIGRWVPIVGWGLLAYDAVSVGLCTRDCMAEGGCN